MAVVGARLMFQVGSRTIAGNLSGKFLHCTMRPAQGGALPPAGEYEILPPVSDPIYGRLALIVPAGGSAAIRIGKHGRLSATISDVSVQVCFGKSAVSGFIERPDTTKSAAGGQVFVLSDRPVLGRNCIVVSSGFADLMDGLQTSGGARVTVA